MNVANSPGESLPWRISCPPNHRIIPVVIAKARTNTEVFNASCLPAFIVDWAISLAADWNLFISWCLAPKTRMIRTPFRFSCNNVVRCPNLLCICSQSWRKDKLVTVDRQNTIGMNPRLMTASLQLVIIKMIVVPDKRNMVWLILNVPVCMKFLMASTSAVAFDIKFPVCWRSWKEKLRFKRCW